MQCQIKDGGLVPKSLYRSLEFSEGEESWSSEIYQTAHVSKGSPLEVGCRKQHYSKTCIIELIILLLPQVTYNLFARWVPINYLVNLTNILGVKHGGFRCNPGEVYVNVNEALNTMEVSAIGIRGHLTCTDSGSHSLHYSLTGLGDNQGITVSHYVGFWCHERRCSIHSFQTQASSWSRQ